MSQGPTPAGQHDASAPAPSCYRHPGREAYIRCTRCDRTICPDCMNPASVGFQCPECVRQGQQGARASQGHFGGRRSNGDPALVTKVLIGLNVAIYLVSGLSNVASLVGRTGISSLQRELGVAAFPIAFEDQYYRLVSAAFIHFGLLHIGLNMFVLWLIGRQLEPVLGRVRYVAVYLVAAIGGNALAYVLAPPGVLEGGASGAVFGLFAALFIVARRLRLDTGGIVAIIVLNFVLSFFYAGISWQAHLGGLAAGAAATAVLVYAPRGPSRTTLQVAGILAVLLLEIAFVVFRTAQLTP